MFYRRVVGWHALTIDHKACCICTTNPNIWMDVPQCVVFVSKNKTEWFYLITVKMQQTAFSLGRSLDSLHSHYINIYSSRKGIWRTIRTSDFIIICVYTLTTALKAIVYINEYSGIKTHDSRNYANDEQITYLHIDPLGHCFGRMLRKDWTLSTTERKK